MRMTLLICLKKMKTYKYIHDELSLEQDNPCY